MGNDSSVTFIEIANKVELKSVTLSDKLHKAVEFLVCVFPNASITLSKVIIIYHFITILYVFGKRNGQIVLLENP